MSPAGRILLNAGLEGAKNFSFSQILYLLYLFANGFAFPSFQPGLL
jgi:hypothetical protein